MRIPIAFGGGAPGDAYLAEGDRTAPADAYVMRFTPPEAGFGHAAGCTCCAPRGPVAAVLASLFRARATGAAPFFHQVTVLASAAAEAAIRDAAVTDVMIAARYKIKPD